MSLVNLTKANFNEMLTESEILVIDCWASWCAACKGFQPVFEKVAEKFPDYTFAKLDTQDQKEVTTNLEVSHIPTLIIFRDEIMLFRQPGYLDEAGLEDVLNQAAGLDMDKIRAHIEKQEEKD
ncbi:MAG: thioredoxin family protein [candidate division Zixibacteria bacterium]|nr:thioredoxin family protein [candidate division Zixibacteria bacterium]NIR66709.1 thioredoxin family protein [candidate division Zixibacteria bacterium]NIS14898.1 thioredoxin family protein [candidate division Zixibacteria bacterium]NIS48248.1 thioredoxin family protein [candidate division Zixibacteria bacterium]NIT51417.1 thioredoxin family protein [candidate division Zixibacteria bacterium]